MRALDAMLMAHLLGTVDWVPAFAGMTLVARDDDRTRKDTPT